MPNAKDGIVWPVLSFRRGAEAFSFGAWAMVRTGWATSRGLGDDESFLELFDRGCDMSWM